MSIRPVKRLIKSKPTREGAGVHLRRAFGFAATALTRDVRGSVEAELGGLAGEARAEVERSTGDAVRGFERLARLEGTFRSELSRGEPTP